MKEINRESSVHKMPDNLFSIYCGLVIKRIRKEKGITGSELAQKINISQQQMSRYERGVNKFSVDMLFNITANLDTSFEQLIRYVFAEIRTCNSERALFLKTKLSVFDTAYFY